MGILDKLAFWKRDELPDLPGFGGREANTDLSIPGGTAPSGMDRTGLGEFRPPQMPSQPFDQESYPNITPSPGTPPPHQQQNFNEARAPSTDIASKNMEIVSSKLDYIRASLENINQRLTNLEAIARGEEKKPGYRW